MIKTFNRWFEQVRRWRGSPVFCSGSVLAAVLSGESLKAAPAENADTPGAEARYSVQTYVVGGNLLIAPDNVSKLLAPHTGKDVTLGEIVKAARDLHEEFRRLGYPSMSIAIVPDQITNGVVTLNVFQTLLPQVVVSGHPFVTFPDETETDKNQTAETANPNSTPTQTNAVPPVKVMTGPATKQQVANAYAALPEKMAALTAQENDHRVHVVSSPTSTNYFVIQKYLVEGNSVLSPQQIGLTLTNIDGAFGTNVTLDGIRTAVSELQKAYRDRGYVTIAVGLPPQKLTNATLKLHVTEGRLAEIKVEGNHYFSSNNVMRTLPSLHTNMLLNGPVFQAELNRANANQDRQIYPVIGPGPEVGTSELALKVKDHLPLHGKVDLDNQSSPGTPALRVNGSAVYNNLWQMEHSLGIQYGFSPEAYKVGPQWDWYDLPLVANYSAYYRMPIGNPESIEDVVAANPGSFGYSEATRRFNLPPPSGRAEINFYASRSTIDTGLETINDSVIYNVPGVRTITEHDVQQDLTINNTVGFRLSAPLPDADNLHSTVSGGLDFKTYEAISDKTNNFNFAEITVNDTGQPNAPINSTVRSPVPATDRPLHYLPLNLRYDGTMHDFLGVTTLGMGLSVNLWYDGTTSVVTTNGYALTSGRASLQGITGSKKSTGNWVTLTPSIVQVITFHTNWDMTVKLDGQWGSEPLISNEQFGAGGINSVRGYHEGEVFGDSGWHFSIEQQTPPHLIGLVHGNQPLTIRGSAFMDYAKVFLVDPQARREGTPLWGTGVGGIISLGSSWDARFLCSVPLLSTYDTSAYQPFFNFALTAQF